MRRGCWARAPAGGARRPGRGRAARRRRRSARAGRRGRAPAGARGAGAGERPRGGVHLDARLLGLTFALSAAVVLLSALLPARLVSHARPAGLVARGRGAAWSAGPRCASRAACWSRRWRWRWSCWWAGACCCAAWPACTAWTWGSRPSGIAGRLRSTCPSGAIRTRAATLAVPRGAGASAGGGARRRERGVRDSLPAARRVDDGRRGRRVGRHASDGQRRP